MSLVNQLKTAFWLVLMSVLLVLVGRLWFGTTGTYVFLGLAIVMNASAYWFSDRIALASAQAAEVRPEEAPMLHRLADRLAIQYRVPLDTVAPAFKPIGFQCSAFGAPIEPDASSAPGCPLLSE